MMPSMSRPGNPYDNASCESFMKALKRKEIYANDYRDLEHWSRVSGNSSNTILAVSKPILASGRAKTKHLI